MITSQPFLGSPILQQILFFGGFIAILAVLFLFTHHRKKTHLFRISNTILFSLAALFTIRYPITATGSEHFDFLSFLIPFCALYLGPLPASVTFIIAAAAQSALGNPWSGLLIQATYFSIGLLFFHFRKPLFEQFHAWIYPLLGLTVFLLCSAIGFITQNSNFNQLLSLLPQLFFISVILPTVVGFHIQLLSDREALVHRSEQGRARLHSVLDSATDGFALLENRSLVEINQKLVQILGFTPDEIQNSSLLRFSPPTQPSGLSSAEAFDTLIATAESEGKSASPWVFLSPQGLAKSTHLSLIRTAQRNPSGIAVIIQDIEDQRHPHYSLAILSSSLQNSRDAILITDLHSNIVSVNKAFEQMTGYTSAEVMGKNPRFLKGDHHEASYFVDMWNSITRHGLWEGQIWNRTKKGEVLPFQLSISIQKSPEGIPQHYVGTLRDLVELSKTKEMREQISLFDPLTQLETRTGFIMRLTHLLENFKWDEQSFAIVALDIANFKSINNTFGHLLGDSLLEQFAKRLKELASDQLHFARLGGDEFLVAIRQYNPEIQLQPFFDAISSIVKTAFPVGDDSVYLAITMGIVLSEPDFSPEILIKQADTALHQAKQVKTPYVVFDGKMQRQAMQDLTLSKKLKIAIENSIIDVFYQPKINLRTGLIEGMEALARWKDEQGKFIPPGIFVPLAEKNGLINHLFQVIVSKTVKDMSKIFLPMQPSLRVSINLSAHQFEISDLVQEITCRVDYENAPRQAFEFEVTESVFVSNMETTRHTLKQFKDEGFQLSLDDFGTGFSSLTYLNYLPFDTLKIDKSFVDPVPLDLRMNAMTASIVNLAHSINLQCVAEGVETIEQLEFLHQLGCDYYQGYLFSPPVDREKFKALLQKQKDSMPPNIG